MNAVILALVIAGQCGPQGCAVSGYRAAQTVDVKTFSGNFIGHGSGTVIATNQGKAYTLTARHLFQGYGPLARLVDCNGTTCDGQLIASSAGYDLALVESAIPASVMARYQARGYDPANPYRIPIASRAPQSAQVIGYGEGQHQLMGQTGRLLGGPFRVTGSRYSIGGCYGYQCTPREGDSGGGAFSATGFVGVIYGVRTDGVPEGVITGPEAVRDFIVRECGGSKRVAITPFGIFCRKEWSDPQQSYAQPTYVQPNPAPTTTVQVEQGPQGIQGPQGPQGPKGADGKNGTNGVDGKDGTSPDLSDLIAEVKANATAIAALQTTVAKGITFVTPNLDGTTSSQTVKLGDSLGFKIPTNPTIEARFAAIEAKLGMSPSTGK